MSYFETAKRIKIRNSFNNTCQRCGDNTKKLSVNKRDFKVYCGVCLRIIQGRTKYARNLEMLKKFSTKTQAELAKEYGLSHQAVDEAIRRTKNILKVSTQEIVARKLKMRLTSPQDRLKYRKMFYDTMDAMVQVQSDGVVTNIGGHVCDGSIKCSTYKMCPRCHYEVKMCQFTCRHCVHCNRAKQISQRVKKIFYLNTPAT